MHRLRVLAMNERERTALHWYSQLITKGKVAAGNRRAMKDPRGYQQYVFNKFANNPDWLRTITARYQEARDRGESVPPE